jgi:ATP-dependent Clp protease ATP-binding subunit ClpB
MRLDRLTTKFQQAIADAQSVALGRDHQYIEPIHILQALLNQENSTVVAVLNHNHISVPELRSKISRELEKVPTVTGVGGDIQISRDTATALNLCDKLAQKRKDKFITSEVFLLALVEDKGPAGKILKLLGVTKEKVEGAIESLRGGQKVEDASAEDTRQALEKYTVDLTERAEQGKLDPVIGRDEEIRRTVQVLQRRTKNNPVLIGEPGVGKTAIVEGLAQ